MVIFRICIEPTQFMHRFSRREAAIKKIIPPCLPLVSTYADACNHPTLLINRLVQTVNPV